LCSCGSGRHGRGHRLGWGRKWKCIVVGPELQYFLGPGLTYCSVHKPMNFSQNRYPPQFRIPDNPRFTFSRNTQRINGAMTNKRAEIVDTIDIHAIQASELFLATTTIVSAGKNA